MDGFNGFKIVIWCVCIEIPSQFMVCIEGTTNNIDIIY